MSISLGSLCAHVLGREAICIDMTFSPAKPLVAGLALLCCLYFYQKRKTRHVHFGDVQYESQPLRRQLIDKVPKVPYISSLLRHLLTIIRNNPTEAAFELIRGTVD